jgi:hypothetical protein
MIKINIPKKVKVYVKAGTEGRTSRLFIDNDEFPYGTKRGSISVEPYVHTDGNDDPSLKWVTVTFLVDGTVDIPESYYKN